MYFAVVFTGGDTLKFSKTILGHGTAGLHAKLTTETIISVIKDTKISLLERTLIGDSISGPVDKRQIAKLKIRRCV